MGRGRESVGGDEQVVRRVSGCGSNLLSGEAGQQPAGSPPKTGGVKRGPLHAASCKLAPYSLAMPYTPSLATVKLLKIGAEIPVEDELPNVGIRPRVLCNDAVDDADYEQRARGAGDDAQQRLVGVEGLDQACGVQN